MVIEGTVTAKSNKLKEGYTTGACAAAAAKAAAHMLLNGEVIHEIEIMLPGGEPVRFKLLGQHINDGEASCGVVKDAGDDPDITHGMTIYAMVKRASDGVTIKGGDGIGVVTKPGLSIPVGEPAINPMPRKMITENVGALISGEQGIEVTIYAPEGKERAKKTFNEKLGIMGGISILGTTGIVRPMSLTALRDSLYPHVDVAKAMGHTTIALVPGNMGERVAKTKLAFPADTVVQMSNFAGDMLSYSADKGIEQALLLGHIGKMVKIAGGFFDTHSGKTDDPVHILERLIGHTQDKQAVTLVRNANTAEEAALGLLRNGFSSMLVMVAEAVSRQAIRHVEGRMAIGTAITVLSGDIVAMDDSAKTIIGEAI